MTHPNPMTMETVDRQRRYVDSQKQKGQGLGLVFADAFLRGMRDIGYKNPAWALAEELDNSFQAAADTVSIRFGFDPKNKTQKKPDMLALSDNGSGMIPEMISYAVRWGGTDREDDRTGFGRYGYGLPSSLVSLAKRYTVYSKTAECDWYAVTVDIDELATVAGDVAKTERILVPRAVAPPKWLVEVEDQIDLTKLESGTVIVLEELDRLNRLSGWIKCDTLQTKLLQHFGVIYRHWLPDRHIRVNGIEAAPVDPLFLMEHARFYDETSSRAERIQARSFEVDTSRGTKGQISIRASVLPPDFQLENPADIDKRNAPTNKRFPVMKDYNGLLICREHRQIDCVSPPWTTYRNYDRNIKIEIDFDPELDEFFGITTSKQQIEIDDEMWQRLRQNGKHCGALYDLIVDMRRRLDTLRDELKASIQNDRNDQEPARSTVAMEESEKFAGIGKQEPTDKQRKEAKENLEKEAKKQAKVTGADAEEVRKRLEEATRRRRWAIEFAPVPEGPFYRPERLGEQKRVIFNTDHPFYTKLYSLGGPDVRAGLEVLIYVLAERELDARGDAETFYKAERQRWSERLRHALGILIDEHSLVDRANSVAETLHMSLD